MERSSSSAETNAKASAAGRARVIRWLDRAALSGIALGFVLVFQPFAGGTLRSGFFVTAFATVLHIVTSHINRPEDS